MRHANPQWIISIDADERIDSGDAAALRDFLRRDAVPGCAYVFRVFGMQQELEHYVPQHYLWVYRLFAYEPGQSFPDRRLHFVPLPMNIPRVAWVDTTLRIQHLGGATAERRRARFEKYRQADPHNDYQADYTNVLRDLSEGALRWEPRPSGLHVLLAAANPVDRSPAGGAKFYGSEIYHPTSPGPDPIYPYHGYQANGTPYAPQSCRRWPATRQPHRGPTGWGSLRS